MKAYYYDDGVFTFEGAVSVINCNGYATPIRIDGKHMDYYPVLNEKSGKMASGIRITFTTDSKDIVLKIVNDEDDFMMDLFIDDEYYEGKCISRDEDAAEFRNLPEGLKHIEIWLDQRRELKLREILIDDGSKINKSLIDKKRWVHYGSSISHSIEAKSPSTIWTSIVARRMNLHLTNLGFYSECKCEPMMGFIIRDLPADYITLKIGINLVDGDLNRRTFKPNIFGLVNIIREEKPFIPIVLCSPIYTPLYEDIRGGSGYNLKEMREAILECVEIFKKYGDKNIYYTDGLKLFGSEYRSNMPDDLHPDAAGQYIMADNFIKEVFGKYLI